MAANEVRELSARLERLHRIGVTGSLALAAAEERNLAVHDVEDLVGRGCDPVTALRIVWPIDDAYDGLHDHGDQSWPDAAK